MKINSNVQISFWDQRKKYAVVLEHKLGLKTMSVSTYPFT